MTAPTALGAEDDPRSFAMDLDVSYTKGSLCFDGSLFRFGHRSREPSVSVGRLEFRLIATGQHRDHMFGGFRAGR